MTNLRLAVMLLCAAVFRFPVDAHDPVSDSDRYSDAEKTYVPLSATLKIGDAPRHAALKVVYGQKFETSAAGPITITNPLHGPGEGVLGPDDWASGNC